MKRNKLIAMVTAIALCVPMMGVLLVKDEVTSSLSAFAESSVSVWDGTYDTSWYDSEDTEFHLSTAEQLAGFIQMVNDGQQTENVTVYLEANIDFDQKDIASMKTFCGMFNAGNHSIIGLTHPFIDKNYGTVTRCNITAKVSSLNSSGYSGIAFCENYGTISNCNTSGEINVSTSGASRAVGGICGYQDEGIIQNCSSDAVINFSSTANGSEYVGGICGYSQNSVMKNCKFVGESITTFSKLSRRFEVTYDSECYLREFGGYTQEWTGYEPYYNLYYYYYYTGTDTRNAEFFVGGICGKAINSLVESSENSSIIKSEEDWSETFAQAKTFESSGLNRKYYTEGSVSKVRYESQYNSYMGGICGYSDTNISECRNTGTIFNYANPKIYEWYDTDRYAGGICGYFEGEDSVISKSCNYGEISDTANYSGGICGYSSSNTIEDVYNRGQATGGICYEADSSTINRAYNTGTVENAVLSTGTADSSKCYYLSSGGLPGVENAVAKSSANMKAEAFIENLGDAFMYVEGDYPQLVWETYVKIIPDIINMTKLGQQTQLEIETTFSTAPQWISSDTSIATVDENGIVTAVGKGTAVIYAIYEDASAECVVVNEADSYSLNTESVEIETDETAELYLISGFDDQREEDLIVTYESSDNSIATVDKNGVITGVSAGSCTVTASDGENSWICVVEVTEPVTEPPTEPELKAELSEESIMITLNQEAELEVMNYTGNVTWLSSDTKVVSVVAGDIQQQAIIKGISEGTATIYARLENGKSLVCSITVNASEVIPGDVTQDGKFNVADIVAVQKWLLGKGSLPNWKAADFYEDGKINIYDLVLMKKELLKK